MTFGQVVIFTENGEEFNAQVLRFRELDDHVGSSGEPLVDLVFLKEVIKPGADSLPVVQDVVGTSRESELFNVRYDVAHESHSFDEIQKAKHGAVYGGGRWREPELSTFTGRVSSEEE